MRSRFWTLADLIEPAVPRDELKAHLRIDHADEDDLISGLALAATEIVERYTQRVLVARTVTYRLACLPSGKWPIRLPGGAVQGTPTVVVDGAPFTAFEVMGHSPALIVPTADWPTVIGDGYPVVITYTAGPAVVPADLIVAVKMIGAELNERRSHGSSEEVMEVPLNAKVLMDSHRIRPW